MKKFIEPILNPLRFEIPKLEPKPLPTHERVQLREKKQEGYRTFGQRIGWGEPSNRY